MRYRRSESEAQAAHEPVTAASEAEAEAEAEAERQRFLDAIAEGITDVDAGRVHTHAEVLARMHARFAAR